MKIKLEHIALSITNLERSLAFYKDLLEFKLICIIDSSEGQKLGEVAGIPGCRANIAKLKSGNMILELFEYLDPRGRPIPHNHKQADIGLTHFGFETNNIHGDYKRLKEHGVRFYSNPIEYRPGVWNVYFYGPDGETCELRQSEV